MLKTLAVLALAVTPQIVAADPTIAVSVDYARNTRPGLTIPFGIALFSDSPQALVDVTLRQELPPGSEVQAIESPDGWVCSQSGAAFECRISAFGPSRDFQQVRFQLLLPAERSGGQFELPLRITAANAEPLTEINDLQLARMIGVRSTADSGDGTLRAAIADANQFCSSGRECVIDFDLPSGSAFEPLTALPTIVACGSLTMEGGLTHEPGDRPFELSGRRLETARGNGLEYRPVCMAPAHLTVSGLAVNEFPDDGITVAPFNGQFLANGAYNSEVRLLGVFIGTDRTGRQARPNGWRGITAHSPSTRLTVTWSILSGNGRSGVFITDVLSANLYGNWIGTDVDGQPLGNGAAGVFMQRGSLRADYNVIACNHTFGVALVRGASAALQSQNSIFANEFVGIDWGLDGPTRTSGDVDGFPNAPIITSAIYDATTGMTTVRGTLQIDRILGERYDIALFANRIPNARGEWEGETPRPEAGSSLFPQAKTGTYSWEARTRGDLRGQQVTTTLGVARYSDYPAYVSSEFSEALAVQ